MRPGERIDHADGVTLEEAEHMLATRLWQNTARVHFSTMARPEGRLIYGGHIISLARALSFNGLANAQVIAAINAGTHAAPAAAGDTVHAWSEVLDKAETSAPPSARSGCGPSPSRTAPPAISRCAGRTAGMPRA